MAATLDARIRLDSAQFSGGLNRVLRETNSAVGRMSAQFGTLRNVLGAGLVGSYATGFLSDIMAATMQAEKLKMALSATSGSSLLGAKQFEDVRNLSADIGLEVESAAKAMLQFQSAGMSSAESMTAIKSGWNAILSTGGGAGEFSRFSVALQQLSNSPKVLQEEINQLREALPTTAKLMKEAFGTTRAEEIQKLNISGREFVQTLLSAMEKLPQMGDTMEKQIGRTRAKVNALLADIGQSMKLGVEAGGGGINAILDATMAARRFQFDLLEKMTGGDPDKRRALEAMAVKILEIQKQADQRKAKALEDDAKDAASKNKSIEQGKTLAKVFGKFNDIIKETAASSRELAAALDFEDRMRAFTDQEAANAFEASLDRTRAELGDRMKAKREREAEARGEAFNEFVGPQQMGDDEREDWRQRVQRAGMNRSERKAARREEREQEENIRKAADRKTREQMREIKEENRKRAFDDLKNNKFPNEEATKQKLKDANRKAAEEAVKGSAQTLVDILDILKTLATA